MSTEAKSAADMGVASTAKVAEAAAHEAPAAAKAASKAAPKAPHPSQAPKAPKAPKNSNSHGNSQASKVDTEYFILTPREREKALPLVLWLSFSALEVFIVTMPETTILPASAETREVVIATSWRKSIWFPRISRERFVFATSDLRPYLISSMKTTCTALMSIA